jgi:hypothetical protein
MSKDDFLSLFYRILGCQTIPKSSCYMTFNRSLYQGPLLAGGGAVTLAALVLEYLANSALKPIPVSMLYLRKKMVQYQLYSKLKITAIPFYSKRSRFSRKKRVNNMIILIATSTKYLSWITANCLRAVSNRYCM